MSPEIPVRARLQRRRSTLFLAVPAHILGEEYSGRPVLVRSESGSCRSRVLRRASGEVVLVLGPEQSRSLRLAAEATEVELWLRVVDETLRLAPPPDLQEALAARGLSWESLPERDRHLSIGLIREASSDELRRTRIRRIVESLVRPS